jgi:hypothetical protein
MSAYVKTFSDKWAGFLASVWMQVQVALVVGVPAKDEAGSGLDADASAGAQPTKREIRSMNDYAGYHTGSGLGSLDIGGGCSRWGE